MSDILVIKVNIVLKKEKLDELYKDIESQKNRGVILLPPYCDAQMVPEGVEIVFEDLCKIRKENSHD